MRFPRDWAKGLAVGSLVVGLALADRDAVRAQGAEPPPIPRALSQAPGAEPSALVQGPIGGSTLTPQVQTGSPETAPGSLRAPASTGGGSAGPWAKVPPLSPIPRPGDFIIGPTGCGYYTAIDCLNGSAREKPQKYPYPRFSIIPFSFFDVDWRYLDDSNNTDHDLFDPLKRVHLGDNLLLTTGGEVRMRYINEVDSRLSGRDNTYELLRTRVYADLWYQDKFRVFIEYLDAQTYNQDLPPLIIDANHSDLLNAFIDIKLAETCDGTAYARVGRQELLYGSQRLISPLDWANTRRTFQGAKVFYRSEKFDTDAFIVQPVIPDVAHFDSGDDNQVFAGTWTTYRPAKGQAIDAYYLYLDNARHSASGRGGVLGASNFHTVGGRYSGDKDNVLWDFEGAFQFGDFSNQNQIAGMYTTGLGYHFKDLPMNPQAWVYYDYASGDPHIGVGDTHRTFNQLFPFGHYYFGFIDVVGRQNIHDLIRPVPRVPP
jgi:hypothetical protein